MISARLPHFRSLAMLLWQAVTVGAPGAFFERTPTFTPRFAIKETYVESVDKV